MRDDEHAQGGCAISFYGAIDGRPGKGLGFNPNPRDVFAEDVGCDIGSMGIRRYVPLDLTGELAMAMSGQ